MTESTILQALYPWSNFIKPDEVDWDDVVIIRTNDPCTDCPCVRDCAAQCETRITWEQELQS